MVSVTCILLSELIEEGRCTVNELVLTDEQAKLVRESRATVRVVDREGNTYTGIRFELSAAELEETLARIRNRPKDQKTTPGEVVQARLRLLDAEFKHYGELDREYVRGVIMGRVPVEAES